MIPFNSPVINDITFEYIKEVLSSKHLSGDGKFTKLCNSWIENFVGAKKALLVHSGTAALELSAILADIKPGDEVIMPSYTFTSTANCVVLQGGIPVFVDIRSDTLNIDENKIEEAISDKTKAIMVVHYAGVACNMDPICKIARKYNLLVIEDAAQAISSYYKGKHLGTIGDFGCFSFHETKNFMSGEGGAFVTNSEKYAERAEIIREKGTNRSKFFRGQVDKYTWVDKGSSYLPSDIIAAYLYSVLVQSDCIQSKRLKIWQKYYKAFEELENEGLLRRPYIPAYATNNAHMFYILLENINVRSRFISFLKDNEIYAPFHYIPLHSSPAGKAFCKVCGDLSITNSVSNRLVRLPLYFDLKEEEQDKIIDNVYSFWKK